MFRHIPRSIHLFTLAAITLGLAGCGGQGKKDEFKDQDRPKSSAEQKDAESED